MLQYYVDTWDDEPNENSVKAPDAQWTELTSSELEGNILIKMVKKRHCFYFEIRITKDS